MADIVILGDILVNIPIKIDKKILDYCNNSKIVIANLEGPISVKSNQTFDKKNPLKNSVDVLQVLKELNVSIVTLANNHVFDYMEKGFIETIEFLESSGIKWVGAGFKNIYKKELYVPEINSVIVAFSHREGMVRELNDSGSGPYVLNNKELIDKIRKWSCDGLNVLVSYHGGEEFFSVPWPRRHEWGKNLIDNGASVVFGHHSHSIQPVTKYKKGVIIHGTGNFYFETKRQHLYNCTSLGAITGIFLNQNELVLIERGIVRAKWLNCYLSLEQPVKILKKYCDEKVLEKKWCQECRKYLLGQLAKDRKYGHGELWKKYGRLFFNLLRFIYYKKYKSVRERDVLLSSIPVFGYYYCNIMKKRPSSFEF